jgi:hypothetical protein
MVVIGKNFLLVVCLFVVFIGLLLLSVYSKKAKAFVYKLGKKSYNPEFEQKKEHYPFHVVFHPFEGFALMKYRNTYSMKWANSILALYFGLSIFEKLETGFHFNTTRVESFNVINQFALTIGIFLVFVLANWGISTLMDGEGKLKEIYMVTSYALLPKVFAIIPLTLLSKFVTLEEGSFVSILSTIITLWCVLLLIMGIKDTHNYSFAGTIGVILLSVVGILVIVFLLVLIFAMFQQFYIFVKTIFDELTFRL